MYYKRQNDIDSKFDPDDFEPQKSLYAINPLDEDTTVSTMYGEKYDTLKEYDTQSYYTYQSNFDKSVKSKIEYQDIQSNYSKDETSRRIRLRSIRLNTRIVSKEGQPQIFPLEKTHTLAGHLRVTRTYLVLRILIQMMIRRLSRG